MFVVWENEINSDPHEVAERLLSVLCPTEDFPLDFVPKSRILKFT